MIHPRNIVIAPVITEKSEGQVSGNNTYTFKVSINANKIEIKKAIEHIFSVKVLNVNTIRMIGKPKRLGKYSGKRRLPVLTASDIDDEDEAKTDEDEDDDFAPVAKVVVAPSFDVEAFAATEFDAE